ncbi:MAG: hypothetical protein QM731_02325 [Chitinophagaceae bacterium]
MVNTLFQKFKWPFAVFLVGLIIKLLGAWKKVTHASGADELRSIGFAVQITAVLWALIVLLLFKTQNKQQ